MIQTSHLYNQCFDKKKTKHPLSSLQILRVRDSDRPFLPPRPRYRVPGSEVGQRSAGSGRSHQDRRFRYVQGRDQRGQDDENVLRDARLHRAGS